MNYITRFKTGVCAPLLVFTLGLGILSAGAPVKDTMVITGLTDSNGFTPTLASYSAGLEYFYAATVTAGNQFCDTIPVQFDLSGTNFAEVPLTISMNAVGNPTLANDISYNISPFTILDGQSLQQQVIINCVTLPVGNYHANVMIQADSQQGSKVSIAHQTLHLAIHVVSGQTEQPSCLITDSSGLPLTDCSGNAVESNTGGSFVIVTNAKKVTATNPGQFYYNLIWYNGTGLDQTFSSATLTGVNVSPQGTNSVHIGIYNGSTFVQSFDDVNQNGTPCGQVGATCKTPITISAGTTLLLTWHVAYSWIGLQVPPQLPTACGISSTNGTISMTGVLTSDLGTYLTCTASANGYKIK